MTNNIARNIARASDTYLRMILTINATAFETIICQDAARVELERRALKEQS